jgi:choline dehydrogenase-like flavoprotein
MTAIRNIKIVDVCIIGSGAGGGVMAQQLAEAGIDVVVLERGSERGPAEFLQQDELSNMIRQTFFAPDYLESRRSDSSEKAIPGKYTMLAQTVGGSTVHWGSWSWRFRPDEFRTLSHEGAIAGANLADWPLSYDELEPYYAKAERVLGISGTAGSNPFGAPRQSAYPNPPHVYRPASRLIESGAKKLSLHPFPIPMAINSRVYGGRAKCMNGGACAGYGCPVHAKASPLSIHLPAAMATGRCRVLPNSRAIEITVDTNNRARSVRYLDANGNEHELRARQIIVACSSIASSHLLLLSKSARYPTGLANSSDQVGRNLMSHIFSQVDFEMAEPSLSIAGPPGNIAIDDFHASDATRGFIRGAVIGEAIEPTPLGVALKAGNYLGNAKRAWGKPLREYLGKFPYIGGMISIGEDLPVASNRVDIDPDHRDAAGIPLPRITHKRHANDLAMARYFEQRQIDIALAGGAKKAWATDYSKYSTESGHIMGTCRMGNDPKTSVLNRWCRTHDIENLWVVDGSFFPTSGGYNPTLTIFANAYRVADYFIRQVKRQQVR